MCSSSRRFTVTLKFVFVALGRTKRASSAGTPACTISCVERRQAIELGLHLAGQPGRLTVSGTV